MLHDELRSEQRLHRILGPVQLSSLGVGAITGALAAFLLLQAIHWPPHEDETLVFFVSRKPFTNFFSTVLEERGGAPLHFLLAHAVDPTTLRRAAVALLVIGLAWVAVIIASHLSLRDRPTRSQRAIGGILVGVLSFAVAAPMAVAASID